MKKRIVVSLALALLLTVSAFVFTACGAKSGEATGYGLVHGHYVGKADLTLKNNKVEAITFDEVQMPYNWAVITLSEKTFTNEDGKAINYLGEDITEDDVDYPYAAYYITVTYITGKSFNFNILDGDIPANAQQDEDDFISEEEAEAFINLVDTSEKKNTATKDFVFLNETLPNTGVPQFIAPKKIKVGDIVFDVGTSRGAYTNATTGNLEKYVINHTNAKWYWEKMVAGEYSVLKANGTTALDHEAFDFTKASGNKTYTKGDRWVKSINGYWTGANYPLGWPGNMEAISEAFIGKDISIFNEALSLNADKKWVIGDVTTTATLTDMADYIGVLKTAASLI